MMHTFRLLDMAIEIGRTGVINIERPNREFLLQVKAGDFEYADLMKLADEKKEELQIVFQNSSLPDKPNIQKLESILIEIRAHFYNL